MDVIEQVEFNPPYTLFGQTAISWALSNCLNWQDQFKHLGLNGVKVIKLGKYCPCMVVSSVWEPHPEHPVPYNEVIVSCFAIYRGHIVSLPLKLYLNDNFHVLLGKKYYQLPKVLVTDLQAHVKPMTLESAEESIRIQYQPYLIISRLLFPFIFLAYMLKSIAKTSYRSKPRPQSMR